MNRLGVRVRDADLGLEDMRELVGAAEAGGYDSVWEHVVLALTSGDLPRLEDWMDAAARRLPGTNA